MRGERARGGGGGQDREETGVKGEEENKTYIADNLDSVISNSLDLAIKSAWNSTKFHFFGSPSASGFFCPPAVVSSSRSTIRFSSESGAEAKAEAASWAVGRRRTWVSNSCRLTRRVSRGTG